jgi:hypothetical protein
VQLKYSEPILLLRQQLLRKQKRPVRWCRGRRCTIGPSARLFSCASAQVNFKSGEANFGATKIIRQTAALGLRHSDSLGYPYGSPSTTEHFESAFFPSTIRVDFVDNHLVPIHFSPRTSCTLSDCHSLPLMMFAVPGHH